MKHVLIWLMTIWVLPAYAFTVEDKLADPLLEDRAQTLFATIRCVVCDGQSIADSDVEVAAALRAMVRTHIEHGASDDAILDLVAESYGDEVLLKPPLNSTTYALWFTPLMVLLVGGIILGVFLNRQKG